MYILGMAERARIYTESLLIRVTPGDLEALDSLRGSASRSAYVRALIRSGRAPSGPPAVEFSRGGVMEEPAPQVSASSVSQVRCPHRYASICDECAKKGL